MRDDLQEEQATNEDLQADLSASQNTVQELEDGLRSRDEAISDKEDELAEQEAVLQAKDQQLATKNREVAQLNTVASNLRRDMRTVTTCFGGVSVALLSAESDPALAIGALYEVEDECAAAAEIVEEL